MRKTSTDNGNHLINKSNINTKTSAVNISMYFIIAVFLLLGIIIFNKTSVRGLCLNNEEVHDISDGYYISYNDETVETSLPAKTAKKTNFLTITRHINRNELYGNYISFYAYNAAVDVYINDSKVLSEPDIVDSLGFARPSHWYFIQVPEDDFYLRLDIHSKLDIKNIMTITSGSKSALIYNILSGHAFHLIIGCLAAITGIIIIIASFFINAELNKRLRWLGLISLLAGVWLLCISTALQIFFNLGTIRSYIGYCCYFMFPIVITGFLLTFEYFRQERSMHIMYCIDIIVLASIFLLQLCRILFISNVLWIVHIEIIAIILSVVVTFIRNRKHITAKELDVFISFIVMLFFLTLDIVRYYYDKTAYTRIEFSVYGIMLLLLYFIISIFCVIKDSFIQSTRNNIYKELAFTDTMTMVNNRSAFELAMEEERRHTDYRRYILIADLNNLKHVNDNFGHRFGDEAIINTAKLINDNFKHIGTCYRIGGDEFCVIAHNTDLETINKCLEHFHAAVSNIALTTNYPYSVATGYGAIDESGIDNCFKAVDSLMYKNKQKSKKNRQH